MWQEAQATHPNSRCGGKRRLPLPVPATFPALLSNFTSPVSRLPSHQKRYILGEKKISVIP